MSLATVSEGSFERVVRRPEKRPADNGFVTFLNWASFLIAQPCLGLGPHMRTVSICLKCETFAIMDCGRFHRLGFTVAPGGGGGASHLWAATVPDTSIIR